MDRNGRRHSPIKSRQIRTAATMNSGSSALEKLVEAKHVMSKDERLARIDAWDRAARATPHGQPIELK